MIQECGRVIKSYLIIPLSQCSMQNFWFTLISPSNCGIGLIAAADKCVAGSADEEVRGKKLVVRLMNSLLLQRLIACAK